MLQYGNKLLEDMAVECIEDSVKMFDECDWQIPKIYVHYLNLIIHTLL